MEVRKVERKDGEMGRWGDCEVVRLQWRNFMLGPRRRVSIVYAIVNKRHTSDVMILIRSRRTSELL